MIRQAVLDDWTAIELIAKIAFVDAYKEAFDDETSKRVAHNNYNEHSLREMILNPQKRVYVYSDETETLVAFAIVILGTDELEIKSIYVFPGKQRQGIGTKLLDHLLKEHRRYDKVQVVLENGNQNAYDFYRKAGFEQVYCTLVTLENVPVKLRHLEKTL